MLLKRFGEKMAPIASSVYFSLITINLPPNVRTWTLLLYTHPSQTFPQEFQTNGPNLMLFRTSNTQVPSPLAAFILITMTFGYRSMDNYEKTQEEQEKDRL